MKFEKDARLLNRHWPMNLNARYAFYRPRAIAMRDSR